MAQPAVNNSRYRQIINNLHPYRILLILLGITLPDWICFIFFSNQLQGEFLAIEGHFMLYLITLACFLIGGAGLWLFIYLIQGPNRQNKYWLNGLVMAPCYWLMAGLGEVTGIYITLSLAGFYMVYLSFTKPEIMEAIFRAGIGIIILILLTLFFFIHYALLDL
jgi:hypothetical protein